MSPSIKKSNPSLLALRFRLLLTEFLILSVIVSAIWFTTARVQSKEKSTTDSGARKASTQKLSMSAHALSLSKDDTAMRASLSSPANSDAQVAAAINKQFNSAVEVVTEFKPFFLVGDFNADGLEDLLAITRLKVERSQLPKDVRVVNPFGFPDITRPNQSSSGAEAEGVALCFAIVHGGRGGWRAGNTTAKYLLLGGSPIQALNYDNVTSNSTKDLMSLVPASRSRRSKYSEFRIPQSARGAWVLVGTQVGEGFIYWDGKRYRFQDSPDD